MPCPSSSVLYGFSQRVQSVVSPPGDNTALNDFGTLCFSSSPSAGAVVQSNFSLLGDWSTTHSCPNSNNYPQAIIGFNIKQQQDQTGLPNEDNTAANGIKMLCENNIDEISATNNGQWGDWHSNNIVCPEDRQISSFRFQYYFNSNGGDSFAVSNIDFVCNDPIIWVKKRNLFIYNFNKQGKKLFYYKHFISIYSRLQNCLLIPSYLGV